MGRQLPINVVLEDSLLGFDLSLRCSVLDYLSQNISPGHRVVSEYIFNDEIKQKYPLTTQ